MNILHQLNAIKETMKAARLTLMADKNKENFLVEPDVRISSVLLKTLCEVTKYAEKMGIGRAKIEPNKKTSKTIFKSAAIMLTSSVILFAILRKP